MGARYLMSDKRQQTVHLVRSHKLIMLKAMRKNRWMVNLCSLLRLRRGRTAAWLGVAEWGINS
jgi:hypothetical protein